MPTTPLRRAPNRPGLASGAALSRARLRKRARSGSPARLSAGSSPKAAKPCTPMLRTLIQWVSEVVLHYNLCCLGKRCVLAGLQDGARMWPDS